VPGLLRWFNMLGRAPTSSALLALAIACAKQYRNVVIHEGRMGPRCWAWASRLLFPNPTALAQRRLTAPPPYTPPTARRA
jgi:hypothetical protein